MNIHHVAVQTRNYDQAFLFFTELFGLKVKKPTTEYKTRKLCILDAGAIEIELFSNKVSEPCSQFQPNSSGPHHLAFVVDDLNYEIERLHKSGIKIVKYPFIPVSDDKNVLPIAFIEGPDGQEVELRQR
jgi:catechol 2,3-dioxygenase-like lactoylglutathione lyase family enzyme